MTSQPERLRILLAEDDSLMRDVTAQVLKQLGHEIVAVENGSDALKAYRKSPFDAVILDINMPVRNGLDTLRNLLSHDPAARIVMLTGVDETAVAEACVANGAKDFVQKGLGPEALQRALATAFRD